VRTEQGAVEIEGTVYTRPVGGSAGGEEGKPVISGVTIRGRGENARIELEPFYFGGMNDKTDVITVAGSNVEIRDLTIDAGFRVDFPLRILGAARDITVENVEAAHGLRGAVNVLSPDNIRMKNVRANSSVQGGFYFDDLEEGAENVVFEDCSTKGNFRTGVLIRNAYESVVGLNLGGITCYEDHFAVEDRVSGTLSGDKYGEIFLTAPPKNSKGEPIDVSVAKFYAVEGFGEKYKHIRYGMDGLEYSGALAYIETERYGFETKIYYLFPGQAENDCRAGEEVSRRPFSAAFGLPVSVFSYLFNAAKNILS
jgi:hypothetical protein